MNLISGYPFWLIHDGLPFQYEKLSATENAEVVILGGGISGALSAYFLTEAGIDCILADARTIGLGSTCGSTSLLQYELDIPLHQLIKKIGRYSAERAYKMSGEAVSELIMIMNKLGFKEYESRKSLFLSSFGSQKKFIDEESKERKRAGFDIELLSKSEMLSIYGIRAKFGILSELGACTNAYSLTHALLQYCKQKGMRIYDRTKIMKIKKDNDIRLISSEGREIRGKKLINATGYEVIQFIKKKLVRLYTTYAMVSENIEGTREPWRDRIMIWNTDDPYLYLRLTNDNRIMIGGRDDKFNGQHPGTLHLHKKSNLLLSDFHKLFPTQPFDTEFCWSGVFGKTRDSLPYIGTLPDDPNIFYALGFGGNGILFSLIAAKLIRDNILDKKGGDAALFSFGRPSL